MKVSEKEEQELYDWGLKFYEMGWDAAFKNVARLGTFCQGIKVDAVRKYIKEQILKDKGGKE